MKTVIFKNQSFKNNQFPFFLWTEKITIYRSRLNAWNFYFKYYLCANFWNKKV